MRSPPDQLPHGPLALARTVIPADPGVYVLHLRLSQDRRLAIGRLGVFDFPAGEYLYVGSARGPGGLRARLGRHLEGNRALHWHIDYLRAAAEVCGFAYSVLAIPGSQPALECRWAQRLAGLPGFRPPVPGFGAGDCRNGCRAHLVSGTPQSDIPTTLDEVLAPGAQAVALKRC